MRLLIVGLAVLAVVVAGLSTYLINTFYGEDKLREFEQMSRPKVTRVLVAAREIRPGDPIAPTNVMWQTWGTESVNASFASVVEPADSTAESAKRMESYLGQVARTGFAAGEPIAQNRLFKPDGAAFMSGLIRPGMRAIAIPIKPENAVGGFVLPGDHVDVLLTHKLAGDLEKEKRRGSGRNSGMSIQNMPVLTFTTETIVRDVRVVAIDQSHDSPSSKAVISKSVTLEVTPKQAEIIITGISMGHLSVVLRSLGADNANGRASTTDIEVSPLLSKMTGKGPSGASKEKSDSNGTASRTIRIYRGGESTTQEIGVQ